MVEKNKHTPDSLPEEFDTFEELSEFWDAHDLADYGDSLTPVSISVIAEPTHEYVISLSETLNELMREAEKQEGVSVGTLVNLWVQERLQQYQTASS